MACRLLSTRNETDMLILYSCGELDTQTVETLGRFNNMQMLDAVCQTVINMIRGIIVYWSPPSHISFWWWITSHQNQQNVRSFGLTITPHHSVKGQIIWSDNHLASKSVKCQIIWSDICQRAVVFGSDDQTQWEINRVCVCVCVQQNTVVVVLIRSDTHRS